MIIKTIHANLETLNLIKTQIEILQAAVDEAGDFGHSAVMKVTLPLDDETEIEVELNPYENCLTYSSRQKV